jgi:hypothetical protein
MRLLDVIHIRGTLTLISKYGQVKERSRLAQGTVRSKYGHA